MTFNIIIILNSTSLEDPGAATLVNFVDNVGHVNNVDYDSCEVHIFYVVTHFKASVQQ